MQDILPHAIFALVRGSTISRESRYERSSLSEFLHGEYFLFRVSVMLGRYLVRTVGRSNNDNLIKKKRSYCDKNHISLLKRIENEENRNVLYALSNSFC